MRPSGRELNELREVSFELNTSKHAEGSCLVKYGDTHVFCTVTVENQVPSWMRGTGKGWITSEYGMLPRSTNSRIQREAKKGQQTGRTQEIQRLIGRSLRAVANLEILSDIQIKIDCDVLQADGGTRTASISGAYIALMQAFKKMKSENIIDRFPIIEPIAAVSCGIYNQNLLLDLDYSEDSLASSDANFVLTESGKIVEIQCSAEQETFSEEQFQGLLSLAKKGCNEIVDIQKKSLLSLG
ncbi:MAG: ribonuclease PH [Alphaproteobacteria bacterium TMED87]|nr:ribonuclease PH [Rhodospirillaceae bacterium]OUV10817.1 MAG: ribonuclease PH [Alphaproteobacteria bacterium TMED87]